MVPSERQEGLRLSTRLDGKQVQVYAYEIEVNQILQKQEKNTGSGSAKENSPRFRTEWCCNPNGDNTILYR
jgi:hypothetical protein